MIHRFTERSRETGWRPRTLTAVGYAEIHFHLLPGVDDGPSSLEESVALARAAAAEGTATIVATPHVNQDRVPDVGVLPGVVAEVRDRLRRDAVPIEVKGGGELALERVGTLSQAELDTIACGPPSRRWLLLEAPFDGLTPAYSEAADELRARGFGVVVAHPERSPLDDPVARAVLQREFAAGSVMQVNAWSVAGLYGEQVRRQALGVLQTAPTAALASDAHGGERLPALRMGLDAIAREEGDERAWRIAGVARALLELGLPARPHVLR